MKTSKHFLQTGIVTAAFFFVTAFGLTPLARGCTLASLSGGYGASLSGVQVNGSSNINLAVVGRLVADGAGHITSLNGTVSLGGVVVSATGSGTYTVSPACTGSATLTTSVLPTVHINFTLVSSATKALAIGTDSTYVVTGEIDKQ